MASTGCPLCCSKTFSSPKSLKQHLSQIQNLRCPFCKHRCEGIKGLIEHLDNCEVDNKENRNHGETKFVNTDGLEIVKVEKDDDSQNEENLKSVNQDGIQDDPSMIYSCEMCKMTFTSVEEHLSTYHEGEEVVLETEEVEELEECEAPMENADGAQTDDEIFEQDDTTVDEPMEYASESQNGIASDDDTENSIYESQLDNTNNVEPVIIQYIVEDGKVRKLTDEEAEAVTDKSKLFQIHTCPNCKLQFPNLAHFSKHNCSSKEVLTRRGRTKERKEEMDKIREQFRYQCTFCHATYACLMSLNDHMKSHLLIDKTGMVKKRTVTMSLHVCEICNTKFPTFKQLRLHLRMHEPVKSKQVGPPVSYNWMGQPNSNDQNDGTREMFECPICQQSYDKEYEEVHMKYHEAREQFICLVCNRKFDSAHSLELHKKAHSSAKKFTCSYCKKPFKSYESLEKHCDKQCQQRDFECQYCGRRFSRPHEKVKHERIHTGEKPHVCEICGKAFRVTYCLTLHMRTHTGSRPYECDDCGKRFKSQSVFTHHKKTHSEDRNYKCAYCPKAFKTAVQLAGHQNSHTKPFSCTECNRPFASLYAVRAHMETHKRANNLRYECWKCGANYARSFALRDHMIEAHGENSITDKPTEDEQALLELEGATAEAETQDEFQDKGEETQDQQEVEEEEFQVTGTESDACQVEVLEQGAEEEGYVVHVQKVGNGAPMEGNHMEVVET